MLKIQVGRNILLVSTISVERTSIRGVPEVAVKLVRLPLSDLVACLLRNDLEDVGADIPASEGVETPVCGDGGDLGVVVVEAVVAGSNEMLGDCVAEKDAENVVLTSVGLVLIPCNKNKSVLHEMLVLEKRFEESTSPLTSNSDRSVVSIRSHVRSDKHPLRKLVLLEILVEDRLLSINEREVLDLRKALLRGSDAVVENSGVMLANVVILAVLVVHPGEALEARVGHVLLVQTPGDTAVLEKINHGRDVARVAVEVVVLHAKVISRNGGHVVWLRGMGHSKVVLESDTLLAEPGEVGYTSQFSSFD
jgi:hypothetical protein